MTRAINRKRYTSRAWHAGFDQAIAEGLDGDEAKEKARKSSQKASEDFVRLWPQPQSKSAAKKKPSPAAKFGTYIPSLKKQKPDTSKKNVPPEEVSQDVD